MLFYEIEERISCFAAQMPSSGWRKCSKPPTITANIEKQTEVVPSCWTFLPLPLPSYATIRIISYTYLHRSASCFNYLFDQANTSSSPIIIIVILNPVEQQTPLFSSDWPDVARRAAETCCSDKGRVEWLGRSVGRSDVGVGATIKQGSRDQILVLAATVYLYTSSYYLWLTVPLHIIITPALGGRSCIERQGEK